MLLQTSHQKYLDSIIATAKTFALNNSLKIDYQNIFPDRITEIRGHADYQAFKDKYHSSEIQNSLYNDNLINNEILDQCEWARIQVIGCRQYLGVQGNLNKVVEEYLNHIGSKSISFNEVVGVYLRAQLLGQVTLDYLFQGLSLKFKQTTKLLVPKLLNVLYDQNKFGLLCIELIKDLGKNEKPKTQLKEKDSKKDEAPTFDASSNKLETIPAKKDHILNAAATVTKITGDASTRYHLEQSIEEEFHYKVFTTQFDEIIRANKLVNRSEYTNLKQVFDKKIALYKDKAIPHTQKLINFLKGKQFVKMRYDEECGILDHRKLVNIISMSSRNVFKTLELGPNINTAVTMLIDNSGSMRGKHITMATISAALLVEILQRYKVKCEILGFTTSEWRGGKAYLAWQKWNSPQNPGRLNSIRHIIYKSFNEHFRKASNNINIMLKESLLKENIDGEALDWAYLRLLKQPEQNKILFMISDGAPVDDMTLKHNNKGLLDQHLKEVISKIERAGKVKLIAIGIGHDVSKFYSNSITISDVENLAMELFSKLVELFVMKNNKKINRK